MKARSQNLAEFAICLAVVASAILGMQVYVQRGLMARQRGAADFLFSQLGDKASITQYEPYYRTSEFVQINGLPGQEVLEKAQEGGLGISEIRTIIKNSKGAKEASDNPEDPEKASMSIKPNCVEKTGNTKEFNNTSTRIGWEKTAPASESEDEVSM